MISSDTLAAVRYALDGETLETDVTISNGKVYVHLDLVDVIRSKVREYAEETDVNGITIVLVSPREFVLHSGLRPDSERVDILI